MDETQERPSTILLVEDSLDEEVLVLRAIRRAQFPCKVQVAHSTEDAIDYLLSRNAFAGREPGMPDVILTDLRIGSLGGAAFVSAVRTLQVSRLIPIVVLTGAADPAQIEDLYRRGANSYLEKPTDFNEFASSITRLARYWGLLNKSAAPLKRHGSFPYPL